MRRGDWIKWVQMRRWGIGAFDARGNKVPRVKRCRHVPMGIEATALMLGSDGSPLVEEYSHHVANAVWVRVHIVGGTIKKWR